MAEELTARQREAIARVDLAETRLESQTTAMQAALAALDAALDQWGFEHPKRGLMVVMRRNGRWFWRARPIGNPKTPAAGSAARAVGKRRGK